MNTSQARSWKQSTVERPIHTREKQIKVKVYKQGWVTKGEKMLYSIVGITLLIASFVIVTYSSSTDRLNRELQTLEQEVQQQEVVNEGLLFEVRELSKPERITQIAKDKGLKIQDGEIKHAQAIKDN